MSVKAMSLVWDLPCPGEWNGIEFKPGHKYILIAYADHADHHGRNIYPAIATVAKKTGYEDRSVQRLTRELEDMGILIPDGQGPRGTNKWYLPFSQGGDKITPMTNFQGDIRDKSLGDIPSGDIPSGDNLTPELKEPEPNRMINNNNISLVWDNLKNEIKAEVPKSSFETWIEPTNAVDFDGRTLTVSANNSFMCNWLDTRLKTRVQDILGVYVKFAVLVESEQE